MKKFTEVATHHIERSNQKFSDLTIRDKNELIAAYMEDKSRIDRDYAANLIIESDDYGVLSHLLLKLLRREEAPEFLFDFVSNNLEKYLGEAIGDEYEQVRCNLSHPPQWKINEMRRDELAEMINENRRFQ